MYGADCGLFGPDGFATGAVLTVAPNSLAIGSDYLFSLHVCAPDNRQASQVVTVAPSLAGSVYVAITTSTTLINANQKLSISGYINAGLLLVTH